MYIVYTLLYIRVFAYLLSLYQDYNLIILFLYTEKYKK